MRILNVTETYAPFYEFGGPPAKVEALSRGLAARGNEVTVLTADWGVASRVGGGGNAKSFQKTEHGWEGEDRGVRAVYLTTKFKYRATSWNPGIGEFLQRELQNFNVVHIFGLYDLLGPATAHECRNLQL